MNTRAGLSPAHANVDTAWRNLSSYRGCIRGVLIFAAMLALSRNGHADNLDATITAWMAKRSIPGLSLAIIQDGVIVKAKGYGMVEQGSTAVVTTDTLFQACSDPAPPPIADDEPDIKEQLLQVVEQFRTANLNDAWCSAKFLEVMAPHLPQMARDLAAFGALKSIVGQS